MSEREDLVRELVKLDDEIVRLERIKSAARELIHIPALIQALGDNHVGGCSCPLCKLRLALRDTSVKGEK